MSGCKRGEDRITFVEVEELWDIAWFLAQMQTRVTVEADALRHASRGAQHYTALVAHAYALLVEGRLLVVEVEAVANHLLEVSLERVDTRVRMRLQLLTHRPQIHRMLDDVIILWHLLCV